jgi:dipeptidase E
MPKLYLLGGENVHRKSAKHVNEKAFADAGGQPNVLVFPWARPYFDNKYGKRRLLIDYFRSLGAENTAFAEYDHLENIGEKLAESNLVYLTGGQTSVLIERMKNMGLDRQLRSYSGVIVGRSAGALALCKKCLTTCRSNSKLKVVEGLGFVDITMKAHYLRSREDALRRFSLKEAFFAVPSKSALVYENHELSSIGRVYVFRNGERQIFRKTQL